MAYQPKSYKKFVATAATATLVASALVPSASAASFSDVSSNYKVAVDYLVANKIAQGTSDTTFGTTANITRGDAAVMIANALDLNTTTAPKSAFTDLNSRVEGAVNALNAAGIINGKSDTKFAPAENITRAEMAKVIALAYKLDRTGTTNEFTDVNSTFDEYVDALVKHEVTLGKTDKLFGATLDVTRGEFALFIYRAETLVPATPEVVSVSAINAKQIEVDFSVALDATTAEDTDMYWVQRTGDASPVKLSTVDATATAELQADGKTVVITTTSDIETSFAITGSGTPFKFTVDGVKTAGKVAIDAKTITLSVSDSVAPTFVSASASAKTSTNNITLTFSEPVVSTSGVVKVNGVNASVAPGSNPNQLTVTTGANLNAGSTYSLEMLNFVDFAGNYLTPNPVNASVTVSSNVIAPNISGVTVVRDNLVEVTFDKAMDAATLNNTTVRLLDGNYTNIAPTNIVSVLPKANTSNRVFQITLDDTPALPFNNGVFTGTLVFTDSIQDSVGNKLSTTNRVVSISKDTTSPSVSTVSFKKADTTGATYGGVALTNGAVVVKYNEGVTKISSVVGTLRLIDNNGVDVTSTYITNTQMAAASVNPNDNTELVIPLATTVTAASNISSFTLRLPAAVTEDLSVAGNDSNSSVNTFNVEAGSNTSGDTTRPVIVSATPAANNVIQIAVTEANLDNSTATNLNNYRLDGAPLPTGTYVTITGTSPNFVISLNLPAGSISSSKDYALNVSGIKDTAGNVASMFVDNTVALVDDVKPELKTASLNTNGSLTLGYSEALAGIVAASDLVVTLNSKVVDTAQLTLVAGTGGETGKDVLTVDQLVDQGTNAAYGGGDDTLYIDVDGIAGYLAGTDIFISTGSYTALQDGVVFDLRNSSTLKVATIATPVTVDGDGNTLKGNTSVTVK